MSIHDSAVAGDRRKTLEAIRDKLADALDDAPSYAVPQISRELRTTLAELAQMGTAEVKPHNELGNRRADRIAAAKAAAPAGDKKVKRGA